MRRHSIIARSGPADKATVKIHQSGSVVTTIAFIEAEQHLAFGIGQIVDQLSKRGIVVSETAIDLTILAALVTAADTRISRATESQDSWTRELDLYVPVLHPDKWNEQSARIERTLRFLTGDEWRLFFRKRNAKYEKLAPQKKDLIDAPFDTVSLFSGGLDSFVAAIDLMAHKANPLFVSHYWDNSTSSQVLCASRIGAVYGDMTSRHVRAHIGFLTKIVKGSGEEKTTRGRSFLFLALAALAASGLKAPTILVPENGLISLNVPLDALRLGAWSTRTTHPFYLKRWQEILDGLGIGGTIHNPYRFKTKGEMLAACANTTLVKQFGFETISCSSIAKARWKGLSPGHCGYCTPCLIRRASFQHAYGSDKTPYTVPNLQKHAFLGRSAESEHIRSFQLMANRLAQRPGIEHALVHKPGPLSDYASDDINSYAGVFKRGIAEVHAVVQNVVIKP